MRSLSPSTSSLFDTLKWPSHIPSLQQFCKIFSGKKEFKMKRTLANGWVLSSKMCGVGTVRVRVRPMLHFAIDEYNGLFVMDQFQPVSLLHTNNKAHTLTLTLTSLKYFRVVRSAEHFRSVFPFLKRQRTTKTSSRRKPEDVNETTCSNS